LVVFKTEDQIKSTGYVIHTLEAALWCFHTTNTFEDGCIKAVNLGEDSDTTGAVYGQLAGAYYGIGTIPQRWLDKIVLRDIIIDVADKLYHNRKL
jgi:ADP-ribosylglycohydrolase